MLLFAIFRIDAPYHCFSLATPRGKPKMAYPITVCMHSTLCERQDLSTLSRFLSCDAAWQAQNSIPYHSLASHAVCIFKIDANYHWFSLAPPRGKPKMAPSSQALKQPSYTRKSPFRDTGLPISTRYSSNAANMTSSLVFAYPKPTLLYNRKSA